MFKLPSGPCLKINVTVSSEVVGVHLMSIVCPALILSVELGYVIGFSAANTVAARGEMAIRAAVKKRIVDYWCVFCGGCNRLLLTVLTRRSVGSPWVGYIC